MFDSFSEEDAEQMWIIREWTKHVRQRFGTQNIFKNVSREFILDHREQMAEMGVECTPDEVAALIRLISDTMDSDI
tara:strand:- start:48 stop:275 length:228 start_codon:yes stop_codon:yes gene_type:complete